ncbi:hypothetical protein EYF80_051590 [Liparis tanakae]|uniref:Uncharacterized protein n=1 Tax=Liparis tanakae TaxID=230148 RepID=A0A4Z2FBH4_9TELE|nr:hypothetical protein EYF80_051590 [Liparis tanakae]
MTGKLQTHQRKVELIVGKAAFVVESSPSSGCHILGRLGPSDPSLVPPRGSSSLPLIYAMFPEAARAKTPDAPGRSSPES